jgi:hypothetical protein
MPSPIRRIEHVVGAGQVYLIRFREAPGVPTSGCSPADTIEAYLVPGMGGGPPVATLSIQFESVSEGTARMTITPDSIRGLLPGRYILEVFHTSAKPPQARRPALRRPFYLMN